MVCKSIGQANPDIAGPGILVAFAIQSLIAVILSGYIWCLSSIIWGRWNAADREPQTRPAQLSDYKTARETFLYLIDVREAPPYRCLVSRQTALTSETGGLTESYAKLIPMPAWLIGKQPEHPRQRTSESKIEDEITPTTRRLKCANRILLAGSDSQTFAGIALLISALTQSKTLTFYHMHIIYDVASLVIISNCAAGVCMFRHGIAKGYIRLSLIGIWAILFIAYTAVFITRLRKWDDDVPSHCYKTDGIARPQDSHPRADNIYIALTFVFVCCSISGLFGFLEFQTLDDQQYEILSVDILDDQEETILLIAMLQCPLHIYSIFTLRASNERYLEAGSEREWGFGQIAAVVLLGGNIVQFLGGLVEYRETAALDTRYTSDEAAAGNQTGASDTSGEV